MQRISPWAWGGLAVLAAVGVLTFMEYANNPLDISWTDPQQPPSMVQLPLGSSTGRTVRGAPHCRDYPGSLASWDGTVVGDC